MTAPDGNLYYFAYRFRDHTLVPMNDRTAEHFPSLVPTNDTVVPLDELNGTKGTYSVGGGTIMLPEKWFRVAIGAELGGSANQSQPAGPGTNRTSSAAGSGG